MLILNSNKITVTIVGISSPLKVLQIYYFFTFERIRYMKKKIIISFSIIFMVALAITLYTQIWRPLIIIPKEAQCITWDATYFSIEAQAEMVLADEYDKTNFFIHSFNDKLPSQNPDDYMTIYCTLGVENRSIFHMNSVKAIVFVLDNYEENVLFSESSDSAVSGPTWRFSSEDETFIFDVYIADMDETAVRNLIKGLKAKVIYEGDFIGVREEIVDFADCENVSVEFAD